jgi:hypothetical protein
LRLEFNDKQSSRCANLTRIPDKKKRDFYAELELLALQRFASHCLSSIALFYDLASFAALAAWMRSF